MNSRRALVWILASTMAACAAPEATRRARRCTEMCSRVGTVTCLTKQSDARILVLSR
jgi:hypothetical protein